jgi:hypothetical protein
MSGEGCKARGMELDSYRGLDSYQGLDDTYTYRHTVDGLIWWNKDSQKLMVAHKGIVAVDSFFVRMHQRRLALGQRWTTKNEGVP